MKYAEKTKFNTALITGASGGLGTALAKRLAEEKIALILSGRDKDKLATLAAEVSKKSLVENIVADLATAEGREILSAAIKKQVPDLVINNAGFGLYGEALSYSDLDQLEIFHVNAEAALQLTLTAARSLLAAGQRGTIVNISSAAAFHPAPWMAVYSASKAFVNAFSESLDYELAPYGVRVLSCSPGMIATPFSLRASGISPAEDAKVKPQSFQIPAEKAAELIWEQIQRGYQSQIIDWRYRFGSRFLRAFLPKKWAASLLQRSIEQRIDRRPLLLD